MSSFDMLLNMARGRAPLERIQFTGGQSGGHCKLPEQPGKKNVPVERLEKGTCYAKRYQEQEKEEDELQLDEWPAVWPPSRGKGMAAVEDLTSHGTSLEDPCFVAEDTLRVYDEYPFDHELGDDLPINDFKDMILAQIEANSVVIVKGPTGCGKSTQVPQCILDDARSHRIHCNIVITLPRRIAATSVAKRVCEERRWNLGSLLAIRCSIIVSIALEKKASEDTRLLFCTAGVLLQQLISQRSLSTYTHIIIDEVHERDSETDFLLIIIKKLMKMRKNPTKLILMSATIDTDKFVEYFSKQIEDHTVEPPVIPLYQGPKWSVQEYYLDSLSSLCKVSEVFLDEPNISSSMYQMAAVLIGVFENVDKKEFKNRPGVLGSVLVFLPGIHEIDTMYSLLRDKNEFMKATMATSGQPAENWMICPLHSTMSFDEQLKVFMNPPSHHRKIILATNIAESSITVADVKYVVDFCLTKHQVQDKDTFYSSLQLSWVSKSQAIQRAGRVGRTGHGRVYRLIPESMYEQLEGDCKPEILRCPLDQLVLKSKKLDFGPPISILGSVMDSPDLTNIQRTILNLKEVGALTLDIDGKYEEDDGQMTFIGTVMEALPLDIQLSKLVLVGHMLSVLRECVIMACCMSGKNIFVTPLNRKLDAFNCKVGWSNHSLSDAIYVYKVWKNCVACGRFKRTGGESEHHFAMGNFLNLKALKEVERMENEVITRLDRLGIQDTRIPMVSESNEILPILLKVALAGAFYPNYFINTPIDEKEAVRTLGGRDPYRTVYLNKFPQDQPGQLYRNSIIDLFKDCGSNIKVQFDGSAKVYVEFGNSIGHDPNDKAFGFEEAVPGRVMKAVYRAVKLRQMKVPMQVPILIASEANRRVKEIFGDALNNVFGWEKVARRPSIKKCQIPELSISHIRVLITHIDNPHNFYVVLCDGHGQHSKSAWINNALRRGDVALEDLNPADIVPKLLCLAPYSSGPGDVPQYYRAKVVHVDEFRAKVFFIDYGNIDIVEKSLIKGYGPALIDAGIKDEPPLCINCRLAEIQPLAYKDAVSGWCKAAVEAFKRKFQFETGFATIYSTVNETMAVYLFCDVTSKVTDKFKLSIEDSFNHLLVRQGYAQFMEEPYLSKENHALREKVKESPDLGRTASYSSIDEHQKYLDEFEFQSPTEKDTRFSYMALQGPNSPLEMSISSITRKCLGKTAGVEFNSVNSVLLDNNPMDTSSRLIVAGTVSQNYKGDRLTLRNTTIMPSIRRIVGIMCLIFTPRAELRVDPTRSHITGALCALGCNDDDISYDQENAIEVTFDCKFDLNDIEKINKIRLWMNDIMCGTATSPEQQTVSRPAAQDAQIKIVKYLVNLLAEVRDPMCPSSYANPYEWNQVSKDLLLDPTRTECKSFVYSLICGVQLLKSSSKAQIASLRKNLKKLNIYANGSESLRNTITCELCQVYFESAQAIALHVETAVHKTRENKILGAPLQSETKGAYSS